MQYRHDRIVHCGRRKNTTQVFQLHAWFGSHGNKWHTKKHLKGLGKYSLEFARINKPKGRSGVHGNQYHATAGSAATEMNHRMSSNESNQWQCVKLFIDDLYLHFAIKNISSQPTLGSRGAHLTRIKGNKHRDQSYGAMEGGQGVLVH